MLNFDFLESSNSQYTGSQTTINQLGTSMSSMSGLSQGLRRLGFKRGSVSRRSIAQSSPVFSDSGAIQHVAEAQSAIDQGRVKKNGNKSIRKKTNKSITTEGNKTDGAELLTPIREFEESDPLAEMASPDIKESKMSTVDAKSYISASHPRGPLKKEVRKFDSSIHYSFSPMIVHNFYF